MSARAELRSDIAGLEVEHDALVRACEREYEELDRVKAERSREEARLAKIKAEINRIKAHFGVSPS